MSLRSHRRRLRGSGQSKAQIDMNSLIDLTFLLLVTFIMTLPALEQGVSILLPQAKTDELPMKDNKATTITIDAASNVFLNNRQLSIDELDRELSALAAQDREVPVLIRGDERVTYGNVMEVVKLVHKYHLSKMALVTVEK